MPAPIIGTRAAIREALHTKSGLFGFGMLGFLVAAVIIIPIMAPFDIIAKWGDAERWSDNPRNAKPEWLDSFSSIKESRNILIDWDDFRSAESNTSEQLKVIIMRARWPFDYDVFPNEYRLQVASNWSDRVPRITVEWTRPDGERLILFEQNPVRNVPGTLPFPPPNAYIEVLPISVDEPRNKPQTNIRDWAIALGADNTTEVGNVRPHMTLHAQVGPGMLNPNRATVLKGEYQMTITVVAFNQSDWVRARFTSYGTAFGLAGTDHLRRDLFIGLLWGAPVALAFGAAAAFLTVLSQVILGALGAYYGGRFDEVIQRATDFLIILPVLPILILIGQLYNVTIVAILFIIVAFNIVGGTTKVVRSIALQVKEELFVESARSYGARRLRILFRYILPRTLPYTFALLALSVPSFIFLEASLSFLGLGDPVLPTWGSIMGDASRNGAAYNGLWWWIAFPAMGIVFTTVAFAFLGYAFDKVINPRLREE